MNNSRCSQNCGKRDSDTCWRFTSWCCALRGGRLRRSPTSCCARVRASIAPSTLARRGALGSSQALLSDGSDDARVRPYISSFKRSLLSIIKCVPSTFGWCRTRWSCATLALELRARRGCTVSHETLRRWLHEHGYVWKRARHVARDDDPERVTKLARIRHIVETLPQQAALFFADELDIHLLAKIGYEWMLKGTQREVMTPGKNEKNYLAGALNHLTGQMLHVVGERKDRFLFLDLLKVIDQKCPAAKFTTVYVVVDNYRIHTAKAVVEWLAAHPRIELVYLPSYCPRANPIERAFGDVHDKCTRNHKRTRLSDLVSDVLWHLKSNGAWRYKLSDIYATPEVDQAVAELSAAEKLKAA